MHLGGEVVAAAVAFFLVTDEHDAELCRVSNDIVTQFSHYAVEGITGLQNAVIDIQLVVGANIEEADTQGQHLLYGLALVFSGNGCTDGAPSREGACASVMCAWDGELADEGIVVETFHPVLIVIHL